MSAGPRVRTRHGHSGSVRGSATAHLERERRRGRSESGTTVYLADLDPDVLRLLTQRKVVDYLRTRASSAALARGDYVIEVIEGRSGEVVTPEKPEGRTVSTSAALAMLWGRIEFNLYVVPRDGKLVPRRCRRQGRHDDRRRPWRTRRVQRGTMDLQTTSRDRLSSRRCNSRPGGAQSCATVTPSRLP